MDWLDAVLAQAAGIKAEIAPRPRTRFDLPLADAPGEAAEPPLPTANIATEPAERPAPPHRDERAAAVPIAATETSTTVLATPAPPIPPPMLLERTHEVRVEHTVQRRDVETRRVEHQRQTSTVETAAPRSAAAAPQRPTPTLPGTLPQPGPVRAASDRPIEPPRTAIGEPPRVVPTAMVRRQEPVPPGGMPTAEPGPATVTVTIGRLDVRAVLQAPAAAAPRPRDPAEAPARGGAPTLDAYLSGRRP